MANRLLTINMITREAVMMFKNSNSFLTHMDSQYDELFAIAEPEVALIAAPVLAKVAKVAALGTAAEQAVETRRGLFGWLARAVAVAAVPL